MVTPQLKESVNEYLQHDTAAKEIAEIEETISLKKDEIIDLESQLLALQKRRPEISIEYRKSIMWCLEVDAGSRHYFLKSKEGLVKCVQFKHKAKLTAKQNNAFGSVLSILFKDGKIGRIEHFGMYFYGLPEMFEKDNDGLFTILNKKYSAYLPDLKQVSV